MGRIGSNFRVTPRRNKRRNYPINGKGMLPSEYMRRNAALTFIRDRTAVEARHWIGVENLMWSSDYPHNDSTWPNSQAAIERNFEGVSEQDREMILGGNMIRLYNLQDVVAPYGAK